MRACARRYHAGRNLPLAWTRRMEELESGEGGLAGPEVAMATEPAAPSLVDRYFTRWYKAGKCGMMVSSALSGGMPRGLLLPGVRLPCANLSLLIPRTQGCIVGELM